MAANPIAARKPAPPRKIPDLVVHADIQQGSPEWHSVRLGKVTASVLAPIMAESEDRVGRTTLMRKLAGERFTGEPAENFRSRDMEKGTEREPEIREWYKRSRFTDVQEVGFVYNPTLDAGWSPDGLVGDDGCVEIKWANPHVLIGILERGTFPSEHRSQCHGAMLIGRRRWCDLVIWAHPRMPKFVARLEPEPAYHQQIRNEIERFNWELQKLVERLRKMGAA